MAVKRRSFEVFSLSFLDCICCGFGAMLLLFVLTIGKHADARASIVSHIEETISRLEQDITKETAATAALRDAILGRDRRIAEERATEESRRKSLTELQDQLALMLQEKSTMKEELERLLAQKKEIPKVEEPPPVPIPNVQRRQYLTGFNFEGKSMLFIVEISGGMLGYTIDEAIAYTGKTDEEKRQSPKWRQVVKSVQWVMANLGDGQAYQILVFNNEARPLVPDSENEWFDPLDRKQTAEVLRLLGEITPGGGANLERAFATAREKFPLTETIVLLTDSLPTLSDSIPVSGATDDRDRERMFRAALRELPRKTPVNTILYPMSGDPAAAFLFWQLADASGGSLISPARGWPDT
ncbi:MAG: hypothetical protein IAE82_12645 [Opitutaceae bacterium]|nr:hypothetical protein [Opitutaceae bacterium]